MKVSGCDVAVHWRGKRTEENDEKVIIQVVKFISCHVLYKYAMIKVL